MLMQVFSDKPRRVVHLAPAGAERYATHHYPRCQRCGAIEIPKRNAIDGHRCNCHLEHQEQPA